MKRIFWGIVSMIGIVGSLKNGWVLAGHFYLWPLVRFVGYTALFVYSLLMLRPSRYNTRLSSRRI